MPRAKSRRRRPAWAEYGETVSVERILAHEDECFRTMRPALRDGANVCVTLQASWGGACYVTAEEMFWSGATMLVLTDLLEESGFAVRLEAVSKTESPRGEYTHTAIIVKDHGEPMRVDALASMVCHAGVFRSFGFRAVCESPFDQGSGLGHEIDWRQAQEHMKRNGYKPEGNAVIVNAATYREDAIEEIKRVLTSLGCGDQG